MMIDSIEWWIAIPVGALAAAIYFYIGIRDAQPDPNPELSRLDLLDGLRND